MLFGYLLMVKKLCMLLLMILKSKVLDGKSMEMVTMLVWIHTQEKLLWDIPRYTHTARLKCEKSCLDKFWNYRSKNRHFLIRGECISLLFGAIILHNLFISFISSILCLLTLLLHSIVIYNLFCSKYNTLHNVHAKITVKLQMLIFNWCWNNITLSFVSER